MFSLLLIHSTFLYILMILLTCHYSSFFVNQIIFKVDIFIFFYYNSVNSFL